jgi:hypothetical protein
MGKKSRPLRIRITEDQFKKLSEEVLKEQTTTSELIRGVLNSYLDRIRRRT